MYRHDDLFKSLLALQDRISRLLDERVRHAFHAADGDAAEGWTPAVDICETGREILLTAEVPGMGMEDLRVEVGAGEIVLRGERGASAAGGECARAEMCRGPFERRFVLDVPMDRARIRATLKHGILSVRIPKDQPPAARRITIEGSA